MIRDGGGRLQGLGGRVSSIRGGAETDSLRRRDKNEDSITIRYRFLDSTQNYKLDSSIADFSLRFPIPATNIYLGNVGSASRSILFSPIMTPGWDPGLHAFDVYRWTVDKARFLNTTRPYSEINYQLGSRSEQQIGLLHTQNIKPHWNFLFQYRMINSPGFFKNQKTNHHNYLLTSWYQSPNRRYNNYFIILGNKLQAGENGGIQDTTDFLSDPFYKDRFTIPTKLGGETEFGRNFFSTDVGTGNRYNEFAVLLRQQYDFGKKDSLVTDSTIIPLFFPRLRFEHTIKYSKRKFQFRDYVGDSTYYYDTYGILFDQPGDTVFLEDSWKELVNDFAIYQFPDSRNLQQFIRLGAAIQNLQGNFPSGKKNYYNVYGHAEYRNKTKNLAWDILAHGKLYFTGLNGGDFSAHVSLLKTTGKNKRGYVELGFENVNRTPGFIFDPRSSFYLETVPLDFKKENTTHLFGNINLPSLRLRLGGHYYLLTNYTYIRDYYQLEQFSALFNVLRISAQKTFKFGKNWNWHAEVWFQQAIGNAPVNLPLVYTRHRFAYEGNLGFKNLDIAFGLEGRYHTPYEADGYSPLLGNFFVQDDITIDNPMPDITAYIHFRIRSFKAYLRFENLNTATDNDGFGFTRNNLAAPGYPYPGLVTRLGIYWNFVN